MRGISSQRQIMAKQEVQLNQDREDRISLEAIVDAYGPEEQAMGWYCYLDDKLTVPFQGTLRLKDSMWIVKLKKRLRIGITG